MIDMQINISIMYGLFCKSTLYKMINIDDMTIG